VIRLRTRSSGWRAGDSPGLRVQGGRVMCARQRWCQSGRSSDTSTDRGSNGTVAFMRPEIGGARCRMVDLLRLITLSAIVTLLLSAASPAVAATATTDPIVGDYNVTYGAPAVVTISISGNVYTITAKSPVRVTGSSCDLPPGTIMATFSGSGSSYSGQHGLWHTGDCSFGRFTSISLTVSGSTLSGVLGEGFGTLTFTKVAEARLSLGAQPQMCQLCPSHELASQLTDSAGNPIVGASVVFRVVGGPDKGTTLTGTTDVAGVAKASLRQRPFGTDDIQATYTPKSGVISTSRDVETTTYGLQIIPFSPIGEVLIMGSDLRIKGCTATVVKSGNQSVIMTAAHCVRSDDGAVSSRILFIPAFTGKAADCVPDNTIAVDQGFTGNCNEPYGAWETTRPAWIDQRYNGNDNRYDFAFFTLDPNRDGTPIQSITGALLPDFNSTTARQPWLSLGYPGGSDHVRSCSGIDAHDSSQPPSEMQIRCDYGLGADANLGGASGGPWLELLRGIATVGAINSQDECVVHPPLLPCLVKEIDGTPLGDAAKASFHAAESVVPGPLF